MFKLINAAKKVSKAMSVTKVDVNPVLLFHQAATFSSFEINLFTESSVSPSVHGLSLLFVLETDACAKIFRFLMHTASRVNWCGC